MGKRHHGTGSPTGRQMDRQMDKRTNGYVNRQMDRQMDRQANGHDYKIHGPAIHKNFIYILLSSVDFVILLPNDTAV